MATIWESKIFSINEMRDGSSLQEWYDSTGVDSGNVTVTGIGNESFLVTALSVPETFNEGPSIIDGGSA